MLNQIVLVLIIAVLTILGILVPVFFPKLTALIKAKIQNDKVAGIMARLLEFVAKVVLELDQTIVDKLKKDGKWNADEAKKVKQMALDKVMSYLGAAGVHEAMVILGIDNKTFEQLISTLIEAEVRPNKLPA